jgi:hypothetical protein
MDGDQFGRGVSTSALDRIEIPVQLRQQIFEKLTPGSTLIIADASDNTAILPEGDDFLVASNDTPAAAEKPKAKQTAAKQAKTKKAQSNRQRQRPLLRSLGLPNGPGQYGDGSAPGAITRMSLLPVSHADLYFGAGGQRTNNHTAESDRCELI